LDDSTFVTCSADSCINAYNRRNVIPFRNYSGHSKDVNAIAFSHDRLYLASCSDDHTARIWPAQDLKKLSDGWTAYHNADQVQVLDKPLQILVGHNDVVTAMSWIPRAGRACLATQVSVAPRHCLISSNLVMQGVERSYSPRLGCHHRRVYIYRSRSQRSLLCGKLQS